jgi:nucleoside-diphosphate-sugar epimerase
MKRVLVMGGTEFVSRTLVKYLIAKDFQVDILTRGKRKVNFSGLNNHLICDRRNQEDMEMILKGKIYDYIFDISAYKADDVKILTSLIDRTNLKRYVMCSSGAVYTPTEEFLTEKSERGENPNWGLYGLDKKHAEDYLFERYGKDNLPIVIFRPPYIYGEENNLYRETFLFNRILNGLPVPVPGEGNTRVQFVHIDDVVQTFVSSLRTENSIGQAYNLTHSEIVTWRELVQTAMEIAETKVEIKKVKYSDMEQMGIVSKQFFPFRDVTYLMDINKLREDNLYVPEINLKQGLKKAFHWYQTQNFLEPLHGMTKIDEVL